MSKLAGAKMELRCGKALKLCLFLRLPICWMCCFALVPVFVSFTAQWDKIVKCCEKQFATDTSYYHIRKAVWLCVWLLHFCQAKPDSCELWSLRGKRDCKMDQLVCSGSVVVMDCGGSFQCLCCDAINLCCCLVRVCAWRWIGVGGGGWGWRRQWQILVKDCLVYSAK